MTHYIAMSGLHGYMPDYCSSGDSLDDAVGSLAQLFDLGRDRQRHLKASRYLELNNHRDGAQYCEITECDCATPEDHNDN